MVNRNVITAVAESGSRHGRMGIYIKFENLPADHVPWKELKNTSTKVTNYAPECEKRQHH